MSLTIIKPGISTSIQDLGRWGFQAYGVPIGGAMDKVAASLANIICGNEEEAVLEMTLHGVSILFHVDTFCCLTGGGCRGFINDVELPFHRLLLIPAGSLLQTHADAKGCRAYLAVSGGFDIERELGSASTYTPSGLGGIHGRHLLAGDVLHFNDTERRIEPASLKILSENIRVSPWQVSDLVKHDDDPAVIHVVPGPEYECFDEKDRERFMQGDFIISSRSNRMGYRLEGQQIICKQQTEMVSTPVASGIIQITHNGDPIILMADAQTTGGYPRIARVCGADLPRLAQCRPGTKIRFTAIDEEESAVRCERIFGALARISCSFSP